MTDKKMMKGKLTDRKEQLARAELTYEWTVLYNDGTVLRQYDDDTLLVCHFGHIDQAKAKEFTLESKREPKIKVAVNLETGLFYINGKPVKEITDGG